VWKKHQALSVDFILADGLLCSIAPKNREAAVDEMKRILKPSGKAYLNASFDMLSNIDKANWDKIPEEFRVEKGQRLGCGIQRLTKHDYRNKVEFYA